MELADIVIDEASAKMRDLGPAGPGDSDPDVSRIAYVVRSRTRSPNKRRPDVQIR